MGAFNNGIKYSDGIAQWQDLARKSVEDYKVCDDWQVQATGFCYETAQDRDIPVLRVVGEAPNGS